VSEEDPTAVEPVESQPLLRIVKGDPTPEEVAALVAVVSSMANAAAESAAREKAPRPEWSARHRMLRSTHRHGPGAWRASAR
jgi:acyl-CoA carboxylase epsilon subunit